MFTLKTNKSITTEESMTIEQKKRLETKTTRIFAIIGLILIIMATILLTLDISAIMSMIITTVGLLIIFILLAILFKTIYHNVGELAFEKMMGKMAIIYFNGMVMITTLYVIATTMDIFTITENVWKTTVYFVVAELTCVSAALFAKRRYLKSRKANKKV